MFLVSGSRNLIPIFGFDPCSGVGTGAKKTGSCSSQDDEAASNLWMCSLISTLVTLILVPAACGLFEFETREKFRSREPVRLHVRTGTSLYLPGTLWKSEFSAIAGSEPAVEERVFELPD